MTLGSCWSPQCPLQVERENLPHSNRQVNELEIMPLRNENHSWLAGGTPYHKTGRIPERPGHLSEKSS